MTTASDILRAAQRYTEADQCSCAHIAIADAAYDYWVTTDDDAPPRCEMMSIYARANSLDVTRVPRCIHEFWDAATLAQRAESWAIAIALADAEEAEDA